MAKKLGIGTFVNNDTKFVVEVDGKEVQVTNMEYLLAKNTVKLKLKKDK